MKCGVQTYYYYLNLQVITSIEATLWKYDNQLEEVEIERTEVKIIIILYKQIDRY